MYMRNKTWLFVITVLLGMLYCIFNMFTWCHNRTLFRPFMNSSHAEFRCRFFRKCSFLQEMSFGFVIKSNSLCMLFVIDVIACYARCCYRPHQ
jgi:hypothetical protein